MVIYMDTLHLNTTKKYFNTLMGITEIARSYKTNNFPDSYCLVTTSLEGDVAISTENKKIFETEGRKVVLKDGNTSFRLH